LLALGFSSKAIEHRISRGRLFRVSRGESAVLSHRSAAALWEIGSEKPGRIDVSVLRRCELSRSGIRFQGRPSLPATRTAVREDIPVTSPTQTLLDLATELDAVPLERAINDADKRGLIDPEALRDELVQFRGEPGVRPLRRLLDKHFFLLSDSDLEIFFRRIVNQAKLQMPLSPLSQTIHLLRSRVRL
jgi:hypothetical protein